MPTHLTLFHALPGAAHADIDRTLHALVACTPPIAVAFPALRFLGRGVAVEADAPALDRLREALAGRWADRLCAQDRQRFRAHVTIQNKVSPAQARALHASLGASWRRIDGVGAALLLWRYLGGPWEPLGRYAFQGEGEGEGEGEDGERARAR